MFLEYEVYYWLVWVAVTYLLARKKGVTGVILCHVLIAISIITSRMLLVSEAMSEPLWDGTPDMDGVFLFGLLISILVVNIMLLPVAILGWLVKRNKVKSLTPHSSETTKVAP